MAKKTVLLFTDYDTKGSGYTNILGPIGNELLQDCDIFAFGISYDRGQHPYFYGVSNLRFNQIPSVINTIHAYKSVDAVIIALDIPMHQMLLENWQKPDGIKYIGIFAVEADPLIPSAAMSLLKMDKRFAISQFAADECHKAGVMDVVHLPIAVDLNTWKMRTKDEYTAIRENMGVNDKFVILVNADANERKNVSVVYQALAELIKEDRKYHLNIVTRKNSPTNWKLDDLAFIFDIVPNVTVYERGLKPEQLRLLYCGADLLVNPSKAESLGMVLLESAAVGLPYMGTNCTGMKENLENGKGIPLDYSFVLIDPFLNGNRYLVSKDTLIKDIRRVKENLSNNPEFYTPMVMNARIAIEKRSITAMGQMIKDALNEQK